MDVDIFRYHLEFYFKIVQEFNKSGALKQFIDIFAFCEII